MVDQKQKVYYLALRLPKNVGANVAVSDGQLDYRYKPHWWLHKMMYTKADQLEHVPADTQRNQRWAYRLLGNQNTQVTLTAIDSKAKNLAEPITMSIGQLADHAGYIPVSELLNGSTDSPIPLLTHAAQTRSRVAGDLVILYK